MDAERKKKLIEYIVFSWMKINEPSSLKSERPPWDCVLKVFDLLGLEVGESEESADIAKLIYLEWKKYKKLK